MPAVPGRVLDDAATPDDLRTVLGWTTRMQLGTALAEECAVEAARRSLTGDRPSWLTSTDARVRLQYLTAHTVLRLRRVI